MKKSFTKILFLSALLVAVISTTVFAADAEERSVGVFHFIADTPIYLVRNTEASVVGFCYAGDSIHVYEQSGSWLRILFNDSVAYIYNSSIYGEYWAHDFETEEFFVDDCTVEYVISWDCMECGYYYEEVIRSASDHTWAFQSQTMSTDCEDDTFVTYECSVCGMVKTETIPAPGHDLEIIYVDGQQITRCLREGCSYQNVFTVPPHDHEWVFESMTMSTDCEDETETVYICSVCGEKKTEVIPAPGHDLEVTEAPFPGQQSICEYGGQRITRCLRDGCTYYRMEKIPAGHTFEEVARVEPTFQSSGTATMQCSRCGFRDYITIPALVDDGMTDDFFFAGSNLLDWRLEIVRDLRPRFRLHFWRTAARCCIR